ncbi:MAG: lactonase family protein [Allomuricauda sp.]
MRNHFYYQLTTRYQFIFICIFFTIGLSIYGQGQQESLYNLIIGTYTRPGGGEGIYVYEFNTQTGEFKYKSVATGVSNPSYLAVSKDEKFVYSVSEIGNGMGSVSSFTLNGKAGRLEFLNQMSSGGNGPCYISTDDEGKYVFVANFGGGNLSAIPIEADGSLGPSIQSIRHQGRSVTGNQTRSHVHATVLSQDGKHLYVPDMGEDKIYSYNVDVNNPNPLTPANFPYLKVTPGNGPRHLEMHPNKDFAYVIHEPTDRITVISTANGLETVQSIDLTSPDHKVGKSPSEASDIHISPDGKFLYGSLRGRSNEIVLFMIKKDGTLEYIDRYSTLGKSPRNFVIDPTGNFLLVGNLGTNEIRIFRRDKKTGKLEPMPNPIKVGMPACLKFTKI